MPIVDNVKTVSANQVWQSPDGQRTLYEVVFDYQGKPLKAKTWSQVIATTGWSGTLETREETNKNTGALETFVKQPQKEGGGYGGGGYRGGGGAKADPFTMYLSYAKDLAVASVHEGKFDNKLYDSLVIATAAGGSELYASRPDAQPSSDTVHTVPDEPVTIEDLNQALGGTKIDAGETPWPTK